MKKTFYFFAFIGSLMLVSCNQGTKDNAKQLADSLENEKNYGDKCYTAIYETDTATMKIRTDEKGKVTGDLIINFGELKPNTLEKILNQGQIAGNFRGDTLFVDYSYTSGTINKTVFKNPLAFLKKGDKLILGVGDIETYVGKSYFVTNKPINFEIARFQFEPVECK
ncbi:hypothetical protein SAMN05421813_11217 [Daejeonella rubra]|uniref:Lipoprotein n=1 Tax=Daejeonella rubra TaxID=990371 RepID=A0A1G9T5S3_9SPHI|nr:hypothetical protein [Daejeonella rubra]SDM42986.1 hypothetical protein SAMN05421813_11217 [Daejeonella rubra]